MAWKCEECGELNDEEVHKSCWKCGSPRFPNRDLALSTSLSSAIHCSTTISIPGREIAESKGVVFGEAILGANIVRDMLAGIRDVVGGRSGAYESKLREARSIAIKEMLKEASELGADAVIGIDVDYESIGQGMMMVCASGTAVTLKAR